MPRRISDRPDLVRVLIVEDEPKTAQVIRKGLEKEGYAVDVVSGGEAAIRRLSLDPQRHVVVLDLTLPERGSFALLGTLRQRFATRVLVLSARDSVTDKVVALDLGADDYLVKPFAFEEFLARVRALARRPAGPVRSLTERRRTDDPP